MIAPKTLCTQKDDRFFDKFYRRKRVVSSSNVRSKVSTTWTLIAICKLKPYLYWTATAKMWELISFEKVIITFFVNTLSIQEPTGFFTIEKRCAGMLCNINVFVLTWIKLKHFHLWHTSRHILESSHYPFNAKRLRTFLQCSYDGCKLIYGIAVVVVRYATHWNEACKHMILIKWDCGMNKISKVSIFRTT